MPRQLALVGEGSSNTELHVGLSLSQGTFVILAHFTRGNYPILCHHLSHTDSDCIGYPENLYSQREIAFGITPAMV